MQNDIHLGRAVSYPANLGGVFVGTVVSASSGLPSVRISALGDIVYKDVSFAGRTNTYVLSAGDEVLCTFVDNSTERIFIIGVVSKKQDVFVSKAEFDALVLRVEALEP
jgi:hypothetical protein